MPLSTPSPHSVRSAGSSRSPWMTCSRRIIAAATRAPSGRNLQPWRFLVVRDPDTKARLGVIFDEAGRATLRRGRAGPTPWGEVPAHRGVRRGRLRRRRRAARPRSTPRSSRRCRTCCWRRGRSGSAPCSPPAGSCARTATPAPRPAGRRLRPRDHSSPPLARARFGPTTRRPMHEVTYRERYGEAWS